MEHLIISGQVNSLYPSPNGKEARVHVTSLRSLITVGMFATLVMLLPGCGLISALEAKPPTRVRLGVLDLGDGRSQRLYVAPSRGRSSVWAGGKSGNASFGSRSNSKHHWWHGKHPHHRRRH